MMQRSLLLQAELALEYSTLLIAETSADQLIRQIVGLVLIWCVADEIQIIELAVHPKFHRCGIARAMINEALIIGQRYSSASK